MTQKNSIDHIYLKPTIIPLSKQWALKTAYIEQLYRALFLAMIDISLSLLEGKPGKLLDLDYPSNQTDYKKAYC